MYKFYVFLFGLSLLGLNASATNYYVSTAGSDAATGTSPATAWQTLTNVNNTNFVPGDSIFFRRGDVFRGQVAPKTSGTAAASIVFDAYGTGAAPVISGAVALTTGWSVESGAVWKVDASSYNTIRQVFTNGQKRFFSRHPNSGFLFVTAAVSGTAFTVNNAAVTGQSAPFFAGSSIAIRAKEWYWYNRDVASVSGNTVTSTSVIPDNADANEGFYFYGGRAMIDTAGEWSYDAATKTLYYQSTSGTDNPGAYVEASVFSYGFNLAGRNYITVRNLAVEKQALSGFYLERSSNEVLENLTIRDCNNDGITAYWFQPGLAAAPPTINNNTVRNCTISDCHYNGIFIQHATGWTVTGNTIRRIGTRFPGYYLGYPGYPNNKTQQGIMSLENAKQNLFSKNVIDSVAKCGINMTGSFNTVEKNRISRYGITYTDLGGVYLSTLNATDNIVRHNFCFEGTSYTGAWNKFTTFDPTLSTAAKRVTGLYGDESTSNNLYQKNTAWSNDFNGFQFVKSFNEKVYDNVSYRNGTGKNEIHFFRWGAGIEVKRNVFYTQPNSAVFGFWWDAAYAPLTTAPEALPVKLAAVDSNKYINPYNATGLIADYNGLKRTLAQWLVIYPGDTKSTTSPHTYAAGETDRSQLFTNMADTVRTVQLTGTWKDLDGNTVGSTVTVDAWFSKVLVQTSTVTSVPQLPAGVEAVKVYPNPTRGVVTLKGLPAGRYAINIFNAVGAQVQTLQVQVLGNYDLQLPGLRAGVYYVGLREARTGKKYLAQVIKK